MLASLGSYAQYTPSFVGIRAGVSTPVENFRVGGSSITNAFAGTGGNIVAEAAYFYTPNVGVGGLFSLNISSVNEEKFGEAFLNQNSSITKVVVESEPYYTASFMVGFYFDVPVDGTIFSLTSKMMMGMLWARNPNLNFTYNFSNVASTIVHQSTENQSNFTFYYGAGIRTQISKKLGLNFDIDYVGSKFRFDYNSLYGSGNERRQFSYLTGSLGLCYFLNY